MRGREKEGEGEKDREGGRREGEVTKDKKKVRD